MTHDDAFLQAIIENPDDDSLRLIYADFLDEHGQSDRAAFIRVQCTLACLPEDDPRREELEATERALLATHADSWARQLNLEARRVTFRRGFPEEVSTDARTLLASGREWFRLAPLRHLTAEGYQGNQLGPEGTRTVASWPQLVRLLSLRLPENGIGDAGAAALAASPNVVGLEVLDLGNDHISGEGASALATSPNLAGLKELCLDYNEIGAEGAHALARSPYLANLTLLDLTHNFFIEYEAEEDEAEAVEALEARFGDRVEL